MTTSPRTVSAETPGQRAPLAVAAVLFGASVVCAAFLLPEHVDEYYAPTSSPDVTYDRWQYLTLIVLGAAAAAGGIALLAATIMTVVSLFRPERRTGGQHIVVPVAAWVLVWFTGLVWVTVWLGNDHAEARSWMETVVSAAGVVGVAIIVVGNILSQPRVNR